MSFLYSYARLKFALMQMISILETVSLFFITLIDHTHTHTCCVTVQYLLGTTTTLHFAQCFYQLAVRNESEIPPLIVFPLCIFQTVTFGFSAMLNFKSHVSPTHAEPQEEEQTHIWICTFVYSTLYIYVYMGNIHLRTTWYSHSNKQRTRCILIWTLTRDHKALDVELEYESC